MITAIVTRLKTGSITNVVPFGVAERPAPPYVVVKPEADPVGRGRAFRVIAHFEPGQQIMLEDYVFNELSLLLTDAPLVSRHGNFNVLEGTQEYGEVVASNDDGTISMERVFLLPSRLF